MLLPLHHLLAAGFDVDVTTIAGYPAKLEWWALPGQDKAVLQTYEALKAKLKQPKMLAEVVENDLDADSDYIAIFIPGGHGAVIGLPAADAVAQTLEWALTNDKFIITLCHGPAALLSIGRGGTESPFKGYSLCVFPDALDEGFNVDIGYLPGHMQGLVADTLRKQGLTVLNDDMTGKVHQDRKLLTGDSPLASNQPRSARSRRPGRSRPFEHHQPAKALARKARSRRAPPARVAQPVAAWSSSAAGSPLTVALLYRAQVRACLGDGAWRFSKAGHRDSARAG